MWRFIPFAISAFLLTFTSVLQTEEESIVYKITNAKELIAQYEKEGKYEECAQLRDMISELEQELESIRKSK